MDRLKRFYEKTLDFADDNTFLCMFVICPLLTGLSVYIMTGVALWLHRQWLYLTF